MTDQPTAVVPAQAGAAAPALTITVYGTPGPQGSKRSLGNGVMVESSKKVKPWRQDVKYAAIAATAQMTGWQLLHGPLAAEMVFTFARPKGHYRTGKFAHLLRDAAPTRPAFYPDLSKICRSTEDALTGVAWKDDALLVDLWLAKRYAGDGDPDTLTAPGAVIRIWALGGAS